LLVDTRVLHGLESVTEQVRHKIAVDRLVAWLCKRQVNGGSLHLALRAGVINAYIRVVIMRLLNLDTVPRLERA
jgi:hypothetical protein